MSKKSFQKNISSVLIKSALVGGFVASSAQAAAAIMVSNSYTDGDNNTFEYSFSTLEGDEILADDETMITALDLTEFMGSFTTSQGLVASISLADLNAEGGRFLFTQDPDGNSIVKLNKGGLEEKFEFNGDLKMGFLDVAEFGPEGIDFNGNVVSTNFGLSGTNTPKTGTNSPESVPEPLTIFGTLTALLFGWSFKKNQRQSEHA